MPSRPIPRWLRYLIVTFLVAVAACRLSANPNGTPAWAGGNGDASDSTKWSSGSAPGNSDHVSIGSGSVSFSNATSFGALDFSGGSLAGNTTLTLGSLTSSTWTGGNMTFSSGGGVAVSSSATLAISGSATNHDFNSTALTNSGTINWSGGPLRSGNGGSLVNNGTFNDTASTDINGAFGGSATFTNGSNGIYNKGNSGQTNFFIPFNNSGTVNVNSGTLNVAGGGTNSGTFAVASGAAVVFNTDYTVSNGTTFDGTTQVAGGNFTASGTINANALSIQGGSVQGNHTFAGSNVNWSNGNLNAPGATTTVAGNSTLTISSASDHDFNGRSVANAGTVNWSGGRLRSGNGGTFTNNGIFNDTASSDVNNDYQGTALVFTNASGATYNKNAAGQTNFFVPFNNGGTVNVNSGTLNLDGGGTLSTGGLLVAGSGANVVFSNSYTLSNASSLTGSGNFSVTGGSFAATGTVNVTNFTIAGGQVSGVQTFKGSLGWSGGNFNDGDATTVDRNATLTISSGTDHDFNGHAFVANGTTNWTGGRLRSGNGGTFTNNGTFNDTASNAVNNDYQGTALIFTNASGATYNKNATGQTNFDVPFNNNGAVNVANGTLNFAGGGTMNAGAQMNAGSGAHVLFSNDYTLASSVNLGGTGDYTVNSGNFTASGNISVSTLNIAGGQIGGTHTLNGTLNWTSGNFNSSGSTTIASGSTLGIGAANDHDFNGRAVVNNGTANWTGGRLRSGNGGTFTNNGTFNDSASNDVNNDYQGTALVFTNAIGATYNKTAAGQTNFLVPFENNGHVNVSAGILNLAGGGTFGTGAALNAAQGASVEFSNDYSLTDASSLTGGGNFTVMGGSFHAAGNVSVANFTIAGGQVSGVQTFRGTLGWTAGTFNSGDTTTIDHAATLTISSGTDHDFNSHQFVNNGTTNWTGGRLRSGNGGTFTNNGTFVDTASNVVNNDYQGPALVFTNASGATYQKSGAGQTDFFVPLVNNGVLNIQNGVLALHTDSTFNNGSSMNGSGLLELITGLLTANGAMNFSHFQINGGTVTGNHTFNGSTEWTSGNFNSGSSTTTIDSGGTLTIDGNADHDFSAHTFENNGTVTWSAGAGRLRSGNAGLFQNNGTFDDSASGVWNNDYQGTLAEFFNATSGIYNKLSAGTTTFDVQFVNAGSVRVQSGTLDLDAGGSSPVGAQFNASAGTALRFSNGNYAVADGAAFGGKGSFVIAGGVVSVGSIVNASDFELSGGTLSGSQTFNGALSWTGGNMNDSGTTTIGGVLTVSSTADHDLSAHTLINNGTINWTGGRLRGGNGSVIINNSIFNDQAAGDINNDYQGALLTFTNSVGGTYVKSGTGTTNIDIPFINNGTLSLLGGKVAFNGTFTNRGGIVLANSAVAQFSGSLSFASTPLTGNGTIDSSLVTTGGLISPGTNPGVLAITGNLTLLSTSRLLIALGGTTAGTAYDVLNVGGNLILGGTLDVQFANGFASSILHSNTFTIANATGTNGLTGAFANIASGQFLRTSDGAGWFQVTYGGGLNSVVLSNFQAIPEPSTYVLFGLGAVPALWLARRKRGRPATGKTRLE